MKKMVIVSLAFHASIILVFTIKTAFFPSDIPKYEPAIRVDLVGLPDKRNPDKPVVAPTPTPAPEPIKETKPEPKTPPKEEKKVTTPTKTSTATQSSALNKLKALSAIEKLKAQNDAKKETKPSTEDKPASEVIKGNVLSVGTALKGLNKLEFDQYIGSLDAHVKNYWTLPEWMLTQGFRAEVMIKIDKTGHIIERKLTKKSGNADFDNRVMSALEQANPFPAPPEKFIDLVGIQGITFAFPD